MQSIISSPQSTISRVLSFLASRSAPAWLVGGYVRDALLGRSTQAGHRRKSQAGDGAYYDLDVIVPEGGICLARGVAKEFGGAFFVLDEERDVGRAILQDETGETLNVDVARLRASELLDDLCMRDFTVNAIAIEVTDIAKQLCGPPQMPRSLISAEGIIDPFAGRRDLEKRVIRAVTEGAFRDDPLRMLRAVRQAIELGFRIEDTTYHLIRRDAHLLPQVSAERVRDELLRIIAAPASWQQVRLLVSLNLLKYILPEMAATSGVTQSAPHYQDVFDHTRSVMAHLEGIYGLLWPEAGYRLPELLADDATVIAGPDLWDAVTEIIAPYADDLRSHLLLPLAIGRVRRDLLMWAALAHDWGKPAMRTEDEDGRTRFLEHERWGALLAERRAQELKLSSDEVAYLARLVDGHMRPAQLAREYPLNRRAIYRYFRDLGAAGPDCVLLSLADHISIHAPKPDLTYSGRRLRTAQMLMEAYFRKRAECVNPPSLLNGHQVMAEFGLKPGPQIGQLLEELREAQAVGKVATPDEARTWLAQRLADAV